MDADGDATERLDSALMTHNALRGFRVQVSTSIAGRIEASLQAAPATRKPTGPAKKVVRGQ